MTQRERIHAGFTMIANTYNNRYAPVRVNTHTLAVPALPGSSRFSEPPAQHPSTPYPPSPLFLNPQSIMAGYPGQYSIPKPPQLTYPPPWPIIDPRLLNTGLLAQPYPPQADPPLDLVIDPRLLTKDALGPLQPSSKLEVKVNKHERMASQELIPGYTDELTAMDEEMIEGMDEAQKEIYKENRAFWK